jgi:hypothetical protein
VALQKKPNSEHFKNAVLGDFAGFWRGETEIQPDSVGEALGTYAGEIIGLSPRIDAIYPK